MNLCFWFYVLIESKLSAFFDCLSIKLTANLPSSIFSFDEKGVYFSSTPIFGGFCDMLYESYSWN